MTATRAAEAAQQGETATRPRGRGHAGPSGPPGPPTSRGRTATQGGPKARRAPGEGAAGPEAPAGGAAWGAPAGTRGRTPGEPETERRGTKGRAERREGDPGGQRGQREGAEARSAAQAPSGRAGGLAAGPGPASAGPAQRRRAARAWSDAAQGQGPRRDQRRGMAQKGRGAAPTGPHTTEGLGKAGTRSGPTAQAGEARGPGRPPNEPARPGGWRSLGRHQLPRDPARGREPPKSRGYGGGSPRRAVRR